MTKPLAAIYALFGAMFATIGIGWAYPDPEPYSLLLFAAGLLLLSASLVLWVRR